MPRSLFISTCFLVILTLFIQCQESNNPLKPTMMLIDNEYVDFNGEKVRIEQLNTKLVAHKKTIGQPMQDSVEIQFLLEQGIDKEVLNQVKNKINEAGIFNVKFVASFQ